MLNKLKCWKIKVKTKKFIVYQHKKRGETAPIWKEGNWKDKDKHNKLVIKHMKKHDTC